MSYVRWIKISWKNSWIILTLEGKSFYGKMIENLGCCKNTKFTLDKWVVDKTLRSRFFHNSEEIGGANEIKEFKGTVVIERPYQCGTAMYKLTKLRMLKFHDFLDKSLNRQDLSYVTWILICFT